MKRLGIVAATAVLIIAAYHMFYPAVTVKYRLTLDAVVDGESKSSSGIVEVVYSANPQFLGASSVSQVKVTGEAIALDLAGHGLLLTLMAAGKNPKSAPEDIAPYAVSESRNKIDARDLKFLATLKGERNLPFDLLPLSVILSDPNNPGNVSRIEGDNFPINLGHRNQLVRAKLTILDNGVWPLNLFGISGARSTTGIMRLVPWLRNNEAMNRFWKSLYATGYRPNGSIKLMMLFVRG